MTPSVPHSTRLLSPPWFKHEVRWKLAEFPLRSWAYAEHSQQVDNTQRMLRGIEGHDGLVELRRGLLLQQGLVL
jgi:hypothetical protein